MGQLTASIVVFSFLVLGLSSGHAAAQAPPAGQLNSRNTVRILVSSHFAGHRLPQPSRSKSENVARSNTGQDPGRT